jgi:hypothetical protein
MPPVLAAAARRGPLLGLAALLLLAARPSFGQTPLPDPAFTSELLDEVADDTPLPPTWLNRKERLAYDLLFLHAQRVPQDVLHRAARHDLTYAHLFGPQRARYRGQLVHLEGRLRWLIRSDPPESVQGLGDQITDLYEAWVQIDHYGGVLFCVVCGSLPPDLKPAEQMDRRVACDAYFFKRLRYETRESPKTERLAPLLIGKTIVPLPPPAEAASAVWAVPGAVLAGTLGLAGVALTAGLAVAWWFRREDRKVRARLRQARPETFAAEPSFDFDAPPFASPSDN